METAGRSEKFILIYKAARYHIKLDHNTSMRIFSYHSGRAVYGMNRLRKARNTGIVVSNPTRGMDVCVRLFCVCVVLCVGSGLAMGSSPFQEVLPTVYILIN
jgi:hypothetical protein